MVGECMSSELWRSAGLVECFSVEEMEHLHRAVLGWNVEYRQLRQGPISYRQRFVNPDSLSISSNRLSNRLHGHCEPPTGFEAFFLPDLQEGSLAVSGKSIDDGDVVVFSRGSEIEFVSQERVRNRAIVLPQANLLAAARSLAPSFRVAARTAAIAHGDRNTLATLKRRIDDLIRKETVDCEAASDLLAETILWIANASGTTGADRLANGAAAAIAGRARDFIENHFREKILMLDLCKHTGVGLRTLQRCFAAYFQVTPTQYIKARRLDAARRDLVAGNPHADSVSKIADRNGLEHFGRFSVDYRAQFGESPRDALARPAPRRHGRS